MSTTTAEPRADQPRERVEPAGRAGTPRTIAAASAAGVLGVYCVFYLRFPQTVGAFVAEHGALGAVLGAVALLVLLVIAGFWAVFCGVSNLKAAFTTGMGFPGLIFGVGLAAGPTAQEAPPRDAPGVVQPRRSLVRDSLGLVLAPVRSVVDEQAGEARRETASARGAIDELMKREGGRAVAPILKDQNVDPRVRAELIESIGRQPRPPRNAELEGALRELERDPRPGLSKPARRARERLDRQDP
jgi:hypothetical protein